MALGPLSWRLRGVRGLVARESRGQGSRKNEGVTAGDRSCL